MSSMPGDDGWTAVPVSDADDGDGGKEARRVDGLPQFGANVRAEITYITAGLADIEARVLLMIARRLERGQREIGVLRKDDPRDWAKEEAEELFDASVYRMLRLLRDE